MIYLKNVNRTVSIVCIITFLLIIIFDISPLKIIYNTSSLLDILSILLLVVNIVSIIIGIFNLVKKNKTIGLIQIICSAFIIICGFIFSSPSVYLLISIVAYIFLIVLDLKNEFHIENVFISIIIYIFCIVEIIFSIILVSTCLTNINNFKKSLANIASSEKTTIKYYGFDYNSPTVIFLNSKKKEINRIQINNESVLANCFNINVNVNDTAIGYIYNYSTEKVTIINSVGEELFEFVSLSSKGEEKISELIGMMNYIVESKDFNVTVSTNN